METTIQPNPGQCEADTKWYTGYRVVIANDDCPARPYFERNYNAGGIDSTKNNLFVELRDANAFVHRNAAKLQVNGDYEEVFIFSSCVTDPRSTYIYEAHTFVGQNLYDNLIVRKFTPDESGKLVARDLNYQL